jgi:hypothetical protein
MLADAGTGLVGWRHLAPVCGHCAAGRAPILTLPEFAARTGGSITVADSADPGSSIRSSLDERPLPEGAGESPIAVLSAEIALLHARLDDIQARLDG